MSAWKDDDEVTTTYGSIQLSLEQAHSAGIKTERERIIKLLEQARDLEKTGIASWLGLQSAIMLIKGETNE